MYCIVCILLGISFQWIPGGSHGFHRVSTGFPHDFREDLEAVADELLRRGLATPGQVQIMFDQQSLQSRHLRIKTILFRCHQYISICNKHLLGINTHLLSILSIPYLNLAMMRIGINSYSI